MMTESQRLRMTELQLLRAEYTHLTAERESLWKQIRGLDDKVAAVVSRQTELRGVPPKAVKGISKQYAPS